MSMGVCMCMSLLNWCAFLVSSYHDTGVVLMAAGITAAVCLSISLFAIQTKVSLPLCDWLAGWLAD